MGQLISVYDDPNTHGNGRLNASTNPNKITIEGLLLVTVESTARVDDVGHTPGPVNSATGSGKVTAFGLKVHRHADLRYCGAGTIVVGQSKVTCG